MGKAGHAPGLFVVRVADLRFRPSVRETGLVLQRFLELGIFRLSPRWATLWLVGELLAFFLVVDLYGWGVAILAQIVSTAIGLAMLRRLGGDLVSAISSPSQGRAVSGAGLAEGLISSLSAVLLILPGFLSSLIAIVLGVTPVRNWLRGHCSKTIGIAGTAVRPGGALDLHPSQWRQTPAESDANGRRLR